MAPADLAVKVFTYCASNSATDVDLTVNFGACARGATEGCTAQACLTLQQHVLPVSAGTSRPAVQLSLTLPHKCQYGQQLCIVGSTSVLGNWNTEQGVGMHWQPKDLWTANITTS